MKRPRCLSLLLALLLCLLAWPALADTQATALTLDTPATVEINTANEKVYFSFTPSETDAYSFYSTSEYDTYCSLYSADMRKLTYDDDGGDRLNFKLEYKLEAGQLYYFEAHFLSSDKTGAFDVTLTKCPLYMEAVESAVKVPYGSPATLQMNVSAKDSSLTYEWRLNGTVVEGATGASYTVESVTTLLSYTCVVTDSLGNSASATVQVRVDSGLTAENGNTTNNRTIYVSPGESIELRVIASCSSGSIHYQWSSNYEEIEGATDATYTTPALSQRADFTCDVSDDFGAHKRVYFYVGIDNELTIRAVNSNTVTVDYGGSATLEASASCRSGSIAYQWFKNNADTGNSQKIEGATGTTLALSNLVEGGQYRCEVQDEYHNYNSVTFNVFINNNLVANAVGPNRISVPYGGSATLAVEASCDSGELTYQWSYSTNGRDNVWQGGDIPYATESSYTLSSLDAFTYYTCTVTDMFKNSVSVRFNVSVENELTISPIGNTAVTVEPGESVTFQAEGRCKVGDITYRWFNMTPTGVNSYSTDEIPGSNSPSLTIENVSAARHYLCEVRDTFGNYQNITFIVNLNNQLTATAVGESNVSLPINGSTTLAVSASCTQGEITYQWTREVYDAANGYRTREAVNGATGSTLTLEGVSRSANYICIATDMFGNQKNVYFYVTVDNGLTVRAVSNTRVSVQYGDSVTMEVSASSYDNSQTYQWYGYTIEGDRRYSYAISGATSATYTAANITASTEFYCQVRDQYGTSKQVYFNISMDNGLYAAAVGETSITVPLGGSVTLSVSAGCASGPITYSWYRSMEDGDNLLNSTINTITISDIDSTSEYYCEVTDMYDNRYSVWFTVSVDNGLTVWPVSATAQTVQPGGSATMTVGAYCHSGADQLTYSWYDSNHYVDDLNSASYTITNLASPHACFCVVTDNFGNEKTVYFVVATTDTQVQPLTVNASVSVTVSESVPLALYSFTPSASDYYTLYSTSDYDTYCTLYDSDWNRITTNDDGGNDCNFSLNAYLNAGATYYYGVRMYASEGSGTFSVTLTKAESKTAYAITLYVGQSVRLPAGYAMGDFKSASITGGQGSILTVSGSALTAVAPGSAQLTVLYDKGYNTYDVSVVYKQNVLTLPAAIKTIEAEAFAGDSTIRFADLGANIAQVGNNAFRDVPLQQVTFASPAVGISGAAFSSKPLIVCLQGSTAELFARNYDLPYVYMN